MHCQRNAVNTGTQAITKRAIGIDSRDAFLLGHLHNNQACTNAL